MGWERRNTRRRRQRYYYLKHRQPDGRVTSTYLGSRLIPIHRARLLATTLGLPAHRAEALLDTQTLDHVRQIRRERNAFRQALARKRAILSARLTRRAGLEDMRVQDALLTLVAESARHEGRRTLTQAGYHEHRGQWRKRRMIQRSKPQDPDTAAPTTEGPAPAPAPASPSASTPTRALMAAIAELRQRAVTEPAIRAKIQELAEQAPEEIITVFGGDLAVLAERVLIGRVADGDPAMAIAVRARLQQIRAELVGSDPNPIEALLAERAALCWLDLYQIEALDAALADGVTLSARDRDFLDRRRDRSHRRFTGTLKTLATVRKLAQDSPAVSVQVVNQLHVSGEPAQDRGREPVPRAVTSSALGEG